MTCPSKPTADIPPGRRAGAVGSPAILGRLSREAPPAMEGIPTALRVFHRLRASPVVDTIVDLCERISLLAVFLREAEDC
jgi:hypothetical protein